jgi:phospholipase/lecithinase/hemolysin
MRQTAAQVVGREAIRQQFWPRGLHLILTAVTIVLGMSLVPGLASAQLFRGLFVFGDGLSDTGNILTATEAAGRDPVPVSPPYFKGRFSNGRVWVEALAEMLGVELTPFLDGGTNFAHGGAEIGLDTEALFEHDSGILIPSIRSQVQTFLAANFFGVDEVNPAALYILWGGANDLRDAIQTGHNPLAEAQTAVDELAAAIADLADAGAIYFLVPNLPNLGQTPESRALGPQAVQQATAASVAFNNALATTLDALEKEHSIVILQLDTFARLEEAIAKPTAFGFTNVTKACLDGDPFAGDAVCANPAGHLFWDSVHPTKAAHALLAGFAAETLPPLITTRGDESPKAVDIAFPEQHLPVLQIRLSTGADMVHLTRVLVHLSDLMGQTAIVHTLQVYLVNDTNANGQFDAGETILATGGGSGVMDSLALDLTPTLDIPAAATLQLLVVLDINNSTADASVIHAARPVLPRSAAGLLGAWPAVLFPVLGLVCLGWQQRRRWRGVGIFLLCCSIVLMSGDAIDQHENANNEDTLSFTVTLPARGMRGYSATSGALTAPAVAIAGAAVRLRR